MPLKDRDFPPQRGEPEVEAPPSIWTFLEYSPLRLGIEALLGAVAGGLLGVFLGEGMNERILFSGAGGVAAPLALMLTPVRGSPWMRGLRYGVALSAMVTLGVSLVGPGRERPVGELLGYGVFLFGVGMAGHSLMAATVDLGNDDDRSEFPS